MLKKYTFSDVDSNLKTTSQIIKNSIQKKFTPFDFYFGDIKDLIPKDISVAIVDENGAILYKNNNKLKIKFSKEDLSKIFNYKLIYKDLNDYRIIINPYKFYGRINFLILGKNTKRLTELNRNIIFLFFIIMFFIAVLLIILTTDTINRILKSIQNITKVAEKVENNSLQYRIENRYNTKEIDELVKTLNNMLDRIEDGFLKVKQFTSDVSHELKTPISSIKNMLEVELLETRTAKEYKEVIIKTLEQINWLSNIVNDLLLMTRIESGKESLNIEKFNLSNVIIELIELMEGIAEEKEVTILFEGEKNIFIEADNNKLKRVILNMMSNGIKYNKKNGELKIEIKELENNIEIIFGDTGIGMKKENLNKIFERFYREDKVRTIRKSGTGLGLSIVKFIIEKHKGKIEVESIEGFGSKFRIILPKNYN
ncbi:HAMP domain-containing sensor histidine kinase [Haliovirga abyssi]|uniref:histidine kinase n=1 Tax=Haliovirga abyssi TaxID=2996794 RepID=A0AAU9D9E4_9FUSO|nr:ATP-binding protein [Haliovirga abyssi]BDU50211.1 two-component sensor histidine kinase [Haliovirga abyssi]